MIKIFYLILFYLIYRITDLVLLLILLVQTILNIFSGEPSDSIKLFGKSLGLYLQQISEFLSYASDEKPYPFSDWPPVEGTINSVDADQAGGSDVVSEKTENESQKIIDKQGLDTPKKA